MLTHIRPAVMMVVVMTVLTGLAYPLAMTGIAQALFPDQANGSLVIQGGHVVGSRLIGQDFTAAKYFHGRPSATSAPDPNDASKTVAAPYNAANSSGSNLGPTSKALVDRVSADIARLRADNPEAVRAVMPIPGDLVTASGSGLDPDISPAAALFQVPRIARVRGLPEAEVRALVERLAKGALFGLYGEPRVNVLALNLALDHAAGG
ncbi:MAG: potassium-transporting ATPase subunit C [Rhodospirillales bacterium 70-18]|nr:K(+)-transporting ATPase subunit C [Rhodospirillales bacterium]OJY65762.1 MAG: potassium-transporting ATPase subunit C [Rhodospirillales bacterium 70-18]